MLGFVEGMADSTPNTEFLDGGFRNPHDPPASLLEPPVLSGVSLGVSVPVVPIGLQCDPLIPEEKIDAVASHLRLLPERDLSAPEFPTHGPLKRRLSGVLPIAGDRTESPDLYLPGSDPKLVSAIVAGDQHRWAPALLGAVGSRAPAVVEFLATCGAIGVSGFVQTAGARANRVPVGYARKNLEGLSADRARLRQSLDAVILQVAGARAEPLIQTGLPGKRLVSFPAKLASFLFWGDAHGLVKTLPRAVLNAGRAEWAAARETLRIHHSIVSRYSGFCRCPN